MQETLDLFAPNLTGRLVAGCDEVGRGPLAGDVVAAAVILSEGHGIVGINDSKKLSEKKRVALAEEIKQKATSWAIALCSPAEIDEINILQASFEAMKRAVESMPTQPDFVLVDGNKLPKWRYESEAVVGGDAKYEAIAAASILAKVARDNDMVAAAEEYPEYGFEKHKGYPTKVHMEALAKHGPCPLHRRSFAPVKRAIQGR